MMLKQVRKREREREGDGGGGGGEGRGGRKGREGNGKGRREGGKWEREREKATRMMSFLTELLSRGLNSRLAIQLHEYAWNACVWGLREFDSITPFLRELLWTPRTHIASTYPGLSCNCESARERLAYLIKNGPPPEEAINL